MQSKLCDFKYIFFHSIHHLYFLDLKIFLLFTVVYNNKINKFI